MPEGLEIPKKWQEFLCNLENHFHPSLAVSPNHQERTKWKTRGQSLIQGLIILEPKKNKTKNTWYSGITRESRHQRDLFRNISPYCEGKTKSHQIRQPRWSISKLSIIVILIKKEIRIERYIWTKTVFDPENFKLCYRHEHSTLWVSN